MVLKLPSWLIAVIMWHSRIYKSRVLQKDIFIMKLDKYGINCPVKCILAEYLSALWCVPYQCKRKMSCYFHFNFLSQKELIEENLMTGVIQEIDFSTKVRPDLLWHLRYDVSWRTEVPKSKRAVQQKLNGLNYLL